MTKGRLFQLIAIIISSLFLLACLTGLVACDSSESNNDVYDDNHEHTVTSWSSETDPTCTVDGFQIGTCDICGETVKVVIPAIGHDWDDGEITVVPTTENEGEFTYTCSNCGETYVVVIDKLIPEETPPDVGDDDYEPIEWTLTFDLNYSNSVSIAVIVTDGEFDMPTDPVREGYMFSGWYGDSACTIDMDIDSISHLEQDSVLYAGWLEREAGYSYITFLYNLTGYGVYKVVQVKTGEVQLSDALSAANCAVSGYKFYGWYADAACTQAINSSDVVTEDLTLYANWYRGWKFEAECTDLTEENSDSLRIFCGFSQIGYPVFSDNACSGGAYIGDMFLEGCYIYFEIISSEAVSDATISLCASLTYGFSPNVEDNATDVQISYDQYMLSVNGNDEVEYEAMVFSDTANLRSGTYTDFKIYDLTHISLLEGTNIIRFTVSNNVRGQGGTQTALAPLVDYMMLYVPTSTMLEMTEHDNAY